MFRTENIEFIFLRSFYCNKSVQRKKKTQKEKTKKKKERISDAVQCENGMRLKDFCGKLRDLVQCFIRTCDFHFIC